MVVLGETLIDGFLQKCLDEYLQAERDSTQDKTRFLYEPVVSNEPMPSGPHPCLLTQSSLNDQLNRHSTTISILIFLALANHQSAAVSTILPSSPNILAEFSPAPDRGRGPPGGSARLNYKKYKLSDDAVTFDTVSAKCLLDGLLLQCCRSFSIRKMSC